MDFLEQELESLRESGLWRELRSRTEPPGRILTIDGQKCINFSANDYLGLASQFEISTLPNQFGSTASPLVIGNLEAHSDLERSLAKFHQLPSVRLFGSGYQANIGLLPALTRRGDLLLSDELNHASIIDACRLSRAELRVYPHKDCSVVEEALAASQAERKFVVTDGVFSMDGDLAPLLDLRKLCDRYNAYLIVDDAHGIGVLGANGRGSTELLDVKVDVLVGGLGKAYGAYGGYVAGSKSLTDLLTHKARSYVFSTALPKVVALAAKQKLQRLAGAEGARYRHMLKQRIEELRDGLAKMGLLEAGAGQSAIFPIVVGEAKSAVKCSQFLLQRGLFAQAIRPPTVPKGSARLRLALSACHTEEDIQELLSGLQSAQDARFL